MDSADALVESLLVALADENGDVRGSAATALARIRPGWRKDSGLAERMLRTLLSDLASHSEIHRNEVLQVVAAAAPEAVRRAALEHPQPGARALALRALTSLDEPEVRATVSALLGDADAGVRWVAANWLVDQMDDAAVPVLIEALGDPERAAAASEALARLGSPTAVGPLVKKWATAGKSDEHVRALAEKLDPSWMRHPEARAALPWLITYWVGGGEDASPLLDQIDPDWNRHPSTRACITTLTERWFESVTFRPEPTRYGYGYGYGDSEKQLEQAKRNRNVIEKRLSRIDRDWPRSPEFRAALPSLVKRWVELVTSTDGSSRNAELRDILAEMDPDWPRSPELRSLVPWLVESWVKLVISSDAPLGKTELRELLVAVDPDWPRSPELRAQFPSWMRRWVDLVTSSRASSGAAELQELLAKANPEWRRSPEVGALLPSLVERWVNLVAASGPSSSEAYMRELFSEADPHWYAPSKMMKHRAKLLEGWASGHDLSTLLDRIDDGWRRSADAWRLVERACASWIEGNSALAADLDAIAPGWRQLRIARVLEDMTKDDRHRYSRSAVYGETARHLRPFGALAIDVLTSRLQSSDANVRNEAVAVLRELNGPAVVESIERVLGTGFEQRTEALKLLGEIGGQSSIPIFAQTLAHTDHRATALTGLIATLKRITEEDLSVEAQVSLYGVVDLVLAHAAQKDASAPWDALGAALVATLARIQDRAALNALGRFVSSGIPTLRKAALEKVVNWVDRVELITDIDTLIPCLVEAAVDPDAAVRANVARVLLKATAVVGASPLVNGLLLLASMDPEEQVRAAAATTPGAIRAPEWRTVFECCRHLLVRNLTHTSGEVRIAAAKAIALLTARTEDGSPDDEALVLDLVALGRRTEAARILVEKVLPSLKRNGQYRRCVELLTTVIPSGSHPEGIDSEARLSVLNSLARYYWSLGEDLQAFAALESANVMQSPSTPKRDVSEDHRRSVCPPTRSLGRTRAEPPVASAVTVSLMGLDEVRCNFAAMCITQGQLRRAEEILMRVEPSHQPRADLVLAALACARGQLRIAGEIIDRLRLGLAATGNKQLAFQIEVVATLRALIQRVPDAAVTASRAQELAGENGDAEELMVGAVLDVVSRIAVGSPRATLAELAAIRDRTANLGLDGYNALILLAEAMLHGRDGNPILARTCAEKASDWAGARGRRIERALAEVLLGEISRVLGLQSDALIHAERAQEAATCDGATYSFMPGLTGAQRLIVSLHSTAVFLRSSPKLREQP